MIDISKFKDLVNKFEEHISKVNRLRIEKLKEKNNSNIIATKENLSALVSTGILEDLNTIIVLSAIPTQERYIDYIIRGLVEQVIEYKYLIRHDNLIEEYFGSKIREEETKKDRFNSVEELGKFGCERYLGGRKSVSAMTKDIKEKYFNKGTLSLYEIYIITSEQIHNSYFNAYLDMFDNDDNREVFTEFQLTLVYTIINKFLKTYDKI